MARRLARGSPRLFLRRTIMVERNSTTPFPEVAARSFNCSRQVSEDEVPQTKNGQQNKTVAGRNQSKYYKAKHQTTKNPSKGLRPPGSVPSCQIFQDDFTAFLGSVENARFKVHKPGCQCSKVKTIRERSSLENDSTLMKGLLVVPDSNARFVPSVFLHALSDAALDDGDEAVILSKELEIKNVIFPPDAPAPDIKVSCAACLLERVPNGFVCINSTSRIAVERARDEARKNAQILEDDGKKLHADHADEVVVLDSKTFRSMTRARKGKNGKPTSVWIDENVLSGQLEDGGVDVKGIEKIILGHHIKSLLRTLKKKEYYFLAIAIRKVESEGNCSKRSIELDLPGGKRHLGESSFDCAIRETLEETSLLVDDTWHAGDGQPLKNALKEDFCNAFYDLHPPVTGTVDEVKEIEDAMSQVQISVS